VYPEDRFWKARWPGDSSPANRPQEEIVPDPVRPDPASGECELSQDEARQLVCAACNDLSQPRQDVLAKLSGMTVAEFVEHKFAPEHIAAKRYSGRAHYQAILKHVLTPEEVDRFFQVETGHSRAKLKTVPDWPYLNNLRLCDARPEHIQQLASAALARGYATQTVAHIRNVVSAIFSHAKQEQCFMGENPAKQVRLSEFHRKDTRTLTLAETKEVLGAMEYPEREMALTAVLTGLNVVEVCGLQWKYVNLSMVMQNAAGEAIAPQTIAVRKQWYRGELGNVKRCRVRDVPIPQPLLQILLKLRSRAKFTSPDDFVLVSRVGTPLNQTNILERRLKPIAKQVKIPALSWNLFLRTRKALLSELGHLFQSYMGMVVRSGYEKDLRTEHNWHCRTQLRQSHPEENRESTESAPRCFGRRVSPVDSSRELVGTRYFFLSTAVPLSSARMVPSSWRKAAALSGGSSTWRTTYSRS
jgi:integrase